MLVDYFSAFGVELLGFWVARGIVQYEKNFKRQSLTGKVFLSFFLFLNPQCPFLFFFFPINFIYLFIYLFMAVLGLRFCARAFSSFGKWRPLFIAERRPLTIAASRVAEHRLQTRRLNSCGSRA